jgi:hypothetical protein
MRVAFCATQGSSLYQISIGLPAAASSKAVVITPNRPHVSFFQMLLSHRIFLRMR